MTHVPNDHFLHQFDRHPVGEPRLRAMAHHCAYLYNCKIDEVAKLEAQLESVVERLREQDSTVAIALDVQAFLDQRRD